MSLIRAIGNKLHELPQTELDAAEIRSIEQAVLVHLKKKDLGQLRDSFEGEAFLHARIRAFGALRAVEETLGLEKTPLTPQHALRPQRSIAVGKACYTILCGTADEYPIFSEKEKSNSLIIVQQLSKSRYAVCGKTNKPISDCGVQFRKAGIRGFYFDGLEVLVDLK